MIYTEEDIKTAVQMAREVCEDSDYTPFLDTNEEFYLKVVARANEHSSRLFQAHKDHSGHPSTCTACREGM